MFLRFWQAPKRLKGKQPDQSDQATEVETPEETKPKKAKKNSPESKDAGKSAQKDTKDIKQKALACEEPPSKKGKSASSPKSTSKAKDVDEKCKKKTAAKSKAKAAVKSKVKKTIRKDSKSKSKSKKLKTAWEEDMLQDIHEEEEPEDVEDAAEPNEDQEDGEEEQPMEDQEKETEEIEEKDQPAAVAPPVAETQLETESEEVKKETAPSSAEPADSQVSLATLLKGNEQMLAQSIATIFESQSQTESQLYAGLLATNLLAFVFCFFFNGGFACCFVFFGAGHFSQMRLGGSASEVFTQNIAAELVKALQNQLSTVAIPAPVAKMPDSLSPPHVDAPKSVDASKSVDAPKSVEANQALPAPTPAMPEHREEGDSTTPSQVGTVGTVGAERQQPEDAETIPGSPRELSKNDIKDWDEGCLSVFGTVLFFLLQRFSLIFQEFDW